MWRHKETGAAVGYIPQNGFAVTFGSPLCEKEQIPRVVKAYLRELDRLSLKPVWCCVDRVTESYLAEELGWSALIVSAEERLDPTEVDPEHRDKAMRRKIHRAEREGVKVHEVDGVLPAELQKRIEQRCQEWSVNRKGTQIHLTSVRPFDDVEHRKYFYATDNNGEVRTPRPSHNYERARSDNERSSFCIDLRAGRPCSACLCPRVPNQVGTRVPWCTSRSN